MSAARRTQTRTSADLPLLVFVAVEVVAGVVWMYLGRTLWFFHDEWDFLAARTAFNVHDLFAPHNEHWSTLPILVYRTLWWVFGLRTYVPYQAITVALHLTAAALLLAVMRRARVNPWIATAAAGLFAWFGAGWQNIVRAFQMSFTGSLVFGLAQLLLADHDGRIDRRDGLGLLAGACALLSSGVGVTMVVVVGMATLLRRGWRAALFHTAPLAAMFAIWFVSIGHRAYTGRRGGAGDIARWVATGWRAVLRDLGQIPGLGVVLAVLLIVGAAMAVAARTPAERRRELAPPAALLAGSLVFMVVTAYGRVAVAGAGADTSRYLHLVAAMVLPALAVAADAVARRWRPFVVIAVALFAVAVPGNVRDLADSVHGERSLDRQYRTMVLSLPREPLARSVPAGVRPETTVGPDITVGWLRAGVASGRIPRPGHVGQPAHRANRIRLSFLQRRGISLAGNCRVLVAPETVSLRAGEVFAVKGNPLRVTRPGGGAIQPATFFLNPVNGSVVRVTHDVGPLVFRPNAVFFPPTVCGIPGG